MMSTRNVELLGYTITIHDNFVRANCSCICGAMWSDGKRYYVRPWRDLNRCIEKAFKHVAMHRMKEQQTEATVEMGKEYAEALRDCLPELLEPDNSISKPVKPSLVYVKDVFSI